jgi:hypothetical protein
MTDFTSYKLTVDADIASGNIHAPQIGQAHTAFELFMADPVANRSQGELAFDLMTLAEDVPFGSCVERYLGLGWASYNRHVAWNALYSTLVAPERGIVDSIRGKATQNWGLVNQYLADRQDFFFAMRMMLDSGLMEYMPMANTAIHNARANFATYRTKLNEMKAKADTLP